MKLQQVWKMPFPIDKHICRELLQRVAAGTSLRRSPRLQELLLFVGHCALEEDRKHIPESEIGTRFFGRQPDYDTGADNIVRSNFTELRKRVQTYFSSEGASEPIHFEIPRGSYLPDFFWKEQATSELVDVEVPATVAPIALPAAKPFSITPKRWSLVLAIIFLIAVLPSVALFYRIRSVEVKLTPWKKDPNVARFWSRFFDGTRPTDLVPGDSAFGVVQSLDNQTFPLSDYASRNYTGKLQEKDPRMLAAIRRISNWGLVGQGDYDFSFRLMSMAGANERLHISSTRNYDPNLLKEHNAIFIGSRFVNPWVELFDKHRAFVFNMQNPAEIINRSPLAGEREVYTWPDSVGYCIVAFLPAPNSDADALIIEGSSSESTKAAADFLFSEGQMRSLYGKLGDGSHPYFELLLRTSWIKGTPYDTQLVTFRSYPH